jgi:alpha-beta hydrolase superfamily lysophospholipase
MAEDLAAAIDYVERLETDRRGVLEERHADSNGIKLVLIAHSAGGALSNYALSRGLFRVKGFCMCAAVPAFGS